MFYTKEQKRIAYKKLSQEVQDFIMSNETTELITNYLNDAGLNQEQSDSADGEILNATFGLQTLSDAINNIAKLSNKNVNDLSKLRVDLENDIFSKIVSYKDTRAPIIETIEKAENNNLENLYEEIKNLPEVKQKFILDKVWAGRTDEIAKKYSLNEIQIDSLINNVLFVLTDKVKKENFLEIIVTELGISRLLAEQIVEDLEVRVFEYALKSIQNKENKKIDESAPQTDNKPLEKTETDIPEVRPENLPATEPGEVAHNVNSSQEQVATSNRGYEGSTSIPREPVASTEPIQQPVSVPRFTAVPMEEENSSQAPVASSRVNTAPETTPIPRPSASGPQESAVGSPEPTQQPVKKYAVDPYREPLE